MKPYGGVNLHSQKEVTDYLGIHYSTVSKEIN